MAKTTKDSKCRKRGSGNGIRKFYHDALKERYFLYPRQLPSRHSVKWYTDGHLVDRPTYGIYSLARLAEHMLWLTKHGRRSQELASHDAVVFYAETRRALQNVLSTYPIGRDLRGKEVESARRVYLRLLEHAMITMHAVTENTKVYYKPIGKLNQEDAELLAAILYEQSKNGTIPPSSALYRKVPS